MRPLKDRRADALSAAALAATIALLPPANATAGTPSVPIEMFDQIIGLMDERPDLPPTLDMPAAPPAAKPRPEAADLCRLARRDVVFSIPKGSPDPAAGHDRSKYEIEKSRLPVLVDEQAQHAARGGSALVVASNVMAVNIDGSPRAYHPRDIFAACKAGAAPGGTGNAAGACALNWLCNAGVRIYDGAKPVRCTAHEDYQRYWDEMWPLIEAGTAVQIPEEYWRRDARRSSDRRYGFFHPDKPITVVFKDTIIPADAGHRPCVRNVAGAKYQGFFVGATSLKGLEHEDEGEGYDASKIVRDRRCSPVPFVNSETLPNIVIPKGGFAGASVGDLVVGWRRDKTGKEFWAYGIVGDEGPNDKFGEASIAFNAELKGLGKRTWETYRDIVRNLHIGDRDNKKETVGILILRGTAERAKDDLSRENVRLQSRRAFARWGGSLANAQKRLKACLSALE